MPGFKIVTMGTHELTFPVPSNISLMKGYPEKPFYGFSWLLFAIRVHFAKLVI